MVKTPAVGAVPTLGSIYELKEKRAMSHMASHCLLGFHAKKTCCGGCVASHVIPPAYCNIVYSVVIECIRTALCRC